ERIPVRSHRIGWSAAMIRRIVVSSENGGGGAWMEKARSLIDERKRAAALAAVGEVRAGMLIGLGTGSTAAFAIAALGGMVRGGLAIRAVATSTRTARMAVDVGIPLLDLAQVAQVDLCIDGVDEIDPAFRAI